MNIQEIKRMQALYQDGSTDTQIAQVLSVNIRTIQRQLAVLRAKGVIDYRKYSASSKVLPQSNNDISEFELLKLFAMHGSKKKIAESLNISRKSLNRLCEHYHIVDTEHTSRLVIKSLKSALGDLEPYKVIEGPKGKGDTLVIQLSDLHAGKIVKDQEGNFIYNEKIYKQRIDKLMAQILKLLDNNIKKGVPITDVVILSTGDLANGENIYATQAYEQELAPPKQVMLVVETIVKLIKALLARQLYVSFFGVKGNHGRTGKDTDPTANWDLMIYEVVDFWGRTMGDKNLLIKYTEEDYMTIPIRGHKVLIRHIAPEQLDTPAGRVKVNEWARQHGVEAIVYGHFHHFGVFDCDGIRVFRGGSVVGMDGLSERMAKDSDPIQLIWGINDHRTMTFLYAVDLASK